MGTAGSNIYIHSIYTYIYIYIYRGCGIPRINAVIGAVIGLSTDRRGVIGASRVGHTGGVSKSEIRSECLKENLIIFFLVILL